MRKEIVSARFSEGTQIKIKITKDATGTVFIARIRGAKNSCILVNFHAILPPNTPAKTPRKNPPIMRQKENPMVFQKEPSKMENTEPF